MSDDSSGNESSQPSEQASQLRELGQRLSGRANKTLEDLRGRLAIVDSGMRVYERDREAAGTLLGSALALRLFLFFVPLVLLVVGLAGLLGRHGGVDSASRSIYGGVGVAVVVFGWFFIIGRALAFSFALNAVIYEELGSASGFVFGLPGLRAIPKRFPVVARFFDLERHESTP